MLVDTSERIDLREYVPVPYGWLKAVLLACCLAAFCIPLGFAVKYPWLLLLALIESVLWADYGRNMTKQYFRRNVRGCWAVFYIANGQCYGEGWGKCPTAELLYHRHRERICAAIAVPLGGWFDRSGYMVRCGGSEACHWSPMRRWLVRLSRDEWRPQAHDGKISPAYPCYLSVTDGEGCTLKLSYLILLSMLANGELDDFANPVWASVIETRYRVADMNRRRIDAAVAAMREWVEELQNTKKTQRSPWAAHLRQRIEFHRAELGSGQRRREERLAEASGMGKHYSV